ncbi:MAG: host attachment protein [Chloroflexi bacterium]|nr:host attachment protein [Chloroflexota bacterium]
MLTDVRSLPAALDELQSRPMPGGVLSVYLDTSPGRTAFQAYLLAYRDGCKQIRASLGDADRERFETAAARIERQLLESLEPSHPGLAAFASGDGASFLAVPLPRAPRDEVGWGEQAQLEPLQALLDEYERIAVLLFDKEQARIYTLFMGTIETRRILQDEVPGKQMTGGWFALAQTRYARHHEDHVLRHARRTIAVLTRMLHERPFDRLIVGGSPEAVSLLRQHLPRPLRGRLAGTINLELFASELEVQRAALKTAEDLERRDEMAMVNELLEDASSRFVVLGLEATLEALGEKRVHLLVLAPNVDPAGAACTQCGRLTTALGACPSCGGKSVPLAALREPLLRQAAEQRASVEFVAGPAAGKLETFGGIGGWTRF